MNETYNRLKDTMPGFRVFEPKEMLADSYAVEDKPPVTLLEIVEEFVFRYAFVENRANKQSNDINDARLSELKSQIRTIGWSGKIVLVRFGYAMILTIDFPDGTTHYTKFDLEFLCTDEKGSNS